MKFLMFVAIAGVTAGAIYHEEIAQAFADASDSAQTEFSTVRSMGDLGNATNSTFEGIGRSLGR